jgi:hypothetical protein
MSYIGSWKVEDTPTFTITARRVDTGAASDADTSPMYHVYEDETATPLITGTMSLLNAANTAGFYSEQITLSAANGFEKGKSYNVYIQATVNGVTGSTTRFFQIEAEVDASVVSDKTGFSLSSPQVFNLIGNVTGTWVGNVNGSVQSVTNPVGINTGTFLEALADKVWDELLSGHLTPGSAGHTLFSRMPTGTVLVGDKNGFSLVSPQSFDLIGNISGTITNVLNVINPVVAGVVTGSVLGNVNGSVNSVVQPVGISTGSFLLAIADQVWDEAISGHLGVGSTGEKLNSAGSASDPWATPLPGAYTASQAGGILASRMPTGTVFVGDKTGFSLSSPQAFDLIGNISGTITNVINLTNAPISGDLTATMKTSVENAVLNADMTGHQAQGSLGQAIGDPVADTNTIYKAVVTDATLATVAQDVVAVKAETASLQNDTNDIQTRLPGALSGDGFMRADVRSIDDELTTGNNATLKLKQLSIVNSTGTAFLVQSSGNDGDGVSIQGNGAGMGIKIRGGIAGTGVDILAGASGGYGMAIESQATNFPGVLIQGVDGVGAVIEGAQEGLLIIGGDSGNGDGLSILAQGTGKSIRAEQDIVVSDGDLTLAAISDGVWDETLAGHLGVGSAGSALNSASSAGDPWNTPLPGVYGAGSAGQILASRMPTGTVIVGTNNDKTGYYLASPQSVNIIGNISGTFVGNVTGSVGEVLTIGAALANKIADHVLRRSYANARASADGDAVSFRSLLGAIAKLVNKWSISGTTLTVTHEDDTTSIGTQTLTGTAGADPITTIDTD